MGQESMVGLTVRWSLAEAPDGVEEALRDYVASSSFARFSGMEGLRFKTWRMIPGDWFEGCYVFATAADRDAFQTQFSKTAAKSPGSQIVGSAPQSIEPCEIVAVAEGAESFLAAPPTPDPRRPGLKAARTPVDPA